MLSHDVDTIHGYKDVLRVAQLEEKMDFRSCFNFVPERYGRVSLALLDQLRRRGFDVAVHGLKHDGKLFLSRCNFERQAPRINAYLKKWQTEGFTSPSMQRDLEWMAALNIDYSMSTFDTDPFEPQPDGVGTIFPFAVYKNCSEQSAFRAPQGPERGRRAVSSQRFGSRTQYPEPSTQNPISSSNSGNPSNSTNPSNSVDSTNSMDPSNSRNSRSFFVELPYTLPQDSTLFVILQEKTIGIWKRKLDWIAEKGGMALLNTHSDYMNCVNGRCGLEEYPIRLYKEFLQYVKDKYEGQYWHVLPKQMANFWREKMVVKANANEQDSSKL